MKEIIYSEPVCGDRLAFALSGLAKQTRSDERFYMMTKGADGGNTA